MVGQGGWIDEMLVHEGGPIIPEGHVTLTNKISPGWRWS
jgi:hypothetical protein